MGETEGNEITGNCEEEHRGESVVEVSTMRNVFIVVGVVFFVFVAVSTVVLCRRRM